MKRIFAAASLLVLVATGADAAPGFGAQGSSLSSGSASAEASRPEQNSILVWLTGFLNAKLKGEATAPASKSKRDTTSSQYECKEEKKAEDQAAAAPAKPGLQAGPEPVYLAF